ncbi:hypothetical protein GCM10027046_37870 [Uliginosibacterium flavum]|uniref:Trypsin-like peptidase domain-containing protein n=1 Tax=Uliginosibacterium flavum TaxID=1396831 RepID=A0ABV2TL30_9RHOO
MNRFEETARPVIFGNGDIDFPYWGKGSSVLLATSNNYYWLTASHVITAMGGSAQTLRIFPSENSKISLPFNEQYTVKTEISEDEEHKDIFALRINIDEFDEFGDAQLVAQDIKNGSLPAEKLTVDEELWVIGYPAESNSIDYERNQFQNTRSVIRAKYKGSSVSDHCHMAKIESSIFLASYDGLSGHPIQHKSTSIIRRISRAQNNPLV